jgi:hypothetical protein
MIQIPPFNAHVADTAAEVTAWTTAPLGTIVFAKDTKKWMVKASGQWDEMGDSSGGGGSPTWGAITGTLSAQTDLQSALNAKAASSHAHAAADITSGTIATARLGGGSASGVSFLRGDQQWATPPSGSDPWTVLKLASDVTTTSATAVDVTGLAFTPLANTNYEVYGLFMVRTNTATVGPRPGCAWPTGLTDGVAAIDVTSSASARVMANGNINAAVLCPVGGLPNTTQSYPAILQATFRTGATPSGTFKVQLASETAGTTVTMKAHSMLRYRIV